MGFFASGGGAKKSGSPVSVEILHRLECKACPLDKLRGNKHPHMKPMGSKDPLIYILGEAPGRLEDERGKQFVGESGQILRRYLPRDLIPHIRWNNVVRTRPAGNAAPGRIEIEACRPSVERDIDATRPSAIFGFGGIPLRWATGQDGIKKWRGRKTPVEIAGQAYWYFSFNHPSALLRLRRGFSRDIPSELERAFKFDVARAIRLVDELSEPHVVSKVEASQNVEIIECSQSGLEKLKQLLDWAAKQNANGVDYETWRTRPYYADSRILTAAIGTPRLSFAFAMDHPQAKWTKRQREIIDKLWRKYLLSQVKKIVHVLRFEQEWSAVFYGADVLRASPWDDTYNQAACLDERFGDTKPGCLSLEFLVQQYFGFNLKSLLPLNRKDLRKEPLNDVLLYNAMDAKWHYMLGIAQERELRAEGLLDVYAADLRKIPAIVLTQIKGFRPYAPASELLAEKYQARILESEKKIAALPEVETFRRRFGETFSPGSNKHMGDILLKIMHRKDGLQDDDKYAVDETILAKIKHPLTREVLKFRKASKRLSTYILPYSAASEFVFPDGLIHMQLNQPGTLSNRTSAEDPSTQNIPKRDEEAKEVRKQIRAVKDHVYVSCDYGQIQFRGIAMMSRDPRLVKYLWDRHDVHEDWTNEIAYAYPQRVGGRSHLKDWEKGGAMKAFRNDVKNQWTFPSVFGARLESRADYLKVPVDVLKPIDRKFWKEFSGIADWHERIRKEYEREGIVRHLDRRLNRAPLSLNQMINYPIQGLEAQIVIAHAFCTLSERAEAMADLYYQPELEIHDDLDFMLPVRGLDDYIENIVTDMLSCPYDFINVPLTVEVAIGKDLYDMDEILVASSDTWRK